MELAPSAAWVYQVTSRFEEPGGSTMEDQGEGTLDVINLEIKEDQTVYEMKSTFRLDESGERVSFFQYVKLPDYRYFEWDEDDNPKLALQAPLDIGADLMGGIVTGQEKVDTPIGTFDAWVAESSPIDAAVQIALPVAESPVHIRNSCSYSLTLSTFTITS
ncbi:MAG: hypothetical protein GX228_06835 [Firmicutes bacterium]|jgi:hypothetical protein|nr:hypothetical protein [Bacillota bacterium]NLL88627.1 hypothetical protein [Bacillota bacterium]